MATSLGSSPPGTSVPSSPPDTVQDTTRPRVIVYAGPFYGHTHEILRENGSHVWVLHPLSGWVARVHLCDTEVLR